MIIIISYVKPMTYTVNQKNETQLLPASVTGITLNLP
jgi:hypothetical protein